MLQISHPLPAGMPSCGQGHQPQLVEARGTPRGVRVGTKNPPRWHVECARCGQATVPDLNPGNALLYWRAPADLFRVPLSKLADVRARVAQAHIHAA